MGTNKYFKEKKKITVEKTNIKMIYGWREREPEFPSF